MNDLTSEELRKKFIGFFKKRGHKIIPSASLIPENDPSILFTTAGMHPLVPFLLGEPHPAGKRLANIQKCLRTDDIEDVGDFTHNTFFEMMGYWSLGDYFKQESIRYTYDFFTQELKIPPEKLSVTVFQGDETIPADFESAKIWQEEIGLKKEKIYFLPRQDNFWIAGDSGPCGPCTEVFYEREEFKKCGPTCQPGCSCGRYIEIGNNVFMEYNKIGNRYTLLKQKNVDVGLGMERILMVLQKKESVFETDLFAEIKSAIEELIIFPELKDIKFIKIIADHLRAATFILAEKIQPSNLERGYVLRRLIRRVIRYGHLMKIKQNFCALIAQKVIKRYQKIYPELLKNKNFILEELTKEEKRFSEVIEKGIKEFEKKIRGIKGKIPGKLAFHLYDTYGFPLELTKELAEEKKLKVDEKGFRDAYEKHRLISKKSAKQKFRGGLADISESTVKL
ncbi:MAG: alanine--tRNA ligase, partial [Minisyncoccia bacterium]